MVKNEGFMLGIIRNMLSNNEGYEQWNVRIEIIINGHTKIQKLCLIPSSKNNWYNLQ